MITRRKSLLLLSSCLTSSTESSLAEPAPNGPPQFKLRIPASTSTEERRSLRLKEFYLVITNQSAVRLGVWRDWSRWGWYCPAVDIKVRETSFEFRRKGKAWARNFADPYYIDPGDHYVLPVALLSDEWIQPNNFKPERFKEAVISATFTIEPSKDTKRLNIWTGVLKAETTAVLDLENDAKSVAS